LVRTILTYYKRTLRYYISLLGPVTYPQLQKSKPHKIFKSPEPNPSKMIESAEKQGVTTRGVKLPTLDLLAGKGIGNKGKPTTVVRNSGDDNSSSESDSSSDFDSESDIEIDDSKCLKAEDDCPRTAEGEGEGEENEDSEGVEKSKRRKEKKNDDIECLQKGAETSETHQKSGQGIKRFFVPTKVVKGGGNAGITEAEVIEKEDLKMESESNVELKGKAKKKSKTDRSAGNKELLEYFEEDPGFVLGKSRISHICKKCNKGVVCSARQKEGRKGKGKRRNQFQNLKKHLESHPELFQKIMQERKRREDAAAEEAKSEIEKHNQMVEKNASLAVNDVTIEDHLLAASEEGAIPGIYKVPTLSNYDERRILMSAAYWFAKDNMSQNSGSKMGFRMVHQTWGLKFNPCPRTIRTYQSALAQECLRTLQRQIKNIARYSVLPLISIQTDVWSDHERNQEMGVRITAFDPLAMKCVAFVLPLVLAEGGKLNADAEASLVLKSLENIQLEPAKVYTSTTDNAQVAVNGSIAAGFVSMRCKAHTSNLVLKDNTPIHSSKDEISVEEDVLFEEYSAKGVVSRRVTRHLALVAARAAHFNRSALSQRLLIDWQASKKKTEQTFKPYAITRWTGLFDAVSRDLEIFEDGATEFFKKYGPQNPMLHKVRPSPDTIPDGRLIRTLLYPLYRLTIEYERDDISLAEGVIGALNTYSEYCGSRIKCVNGSGYVYEEVNNKERIKTMEKADLNEDIQSFRDGIAGSVLERLLKDVDDVSLLSIFLDPKSVALLRMFASAPIKKVKKVANDISERFKSIKFDILEKMSAVYNSRSRGKPERKDESVASVADADADADEIEDLDEEEIAGMTMDERFEREQRYMKKQKLQDDNDEARESHMRFLEEELARFVSARDGSRQQDLQFWKERNEFFPNLFHIYVQSRGIRPSTARLESVFSLASNAVPDQRQSMSTATLNNLLVLKTFPVTMELIAKAARTMAEKGLVENEK